MWTMCRHVSYSRNSVAVISVVAVHGNQARVLMIDGHSHALQAQYTLSLFPLETGNTKLDSHV